ncbi:Isochorismatase hydrolase [Penicillium capsulatum]|uniref:Isochorismatase hydrolase n=1 Tax=Penicillium capsulatum TaxID=69766 RepID=A0A9W9LFL8_9EURO|nr:Isochorismatase hydrolase [Penicillium capsulatum]KAJ6105474.1 Isochorismatase hydrolase [Penicillium capsulatum]
MFDATDKASPGYYGPSQTALLLLDFHQTFVEKLGAEATAAALRTAAEMRKWAKVQGIQVIHALIDTDLSPFEVCKDVARITAVVAAMKAAGGGEVFELHEGGSDNEVTFTRRAGHVSAFRSSGLEDFLRDHEIRSLILTGLSTSGCVLRTALAATDAEYIVSVISDGCADPADGVHEFMMDKILNHRGYVSTAAEFRDGFSQMIAQAKK